ncbi:hypothetical protein ACHHYP_08186 [Achlya hypogyna]|uniref:Uncharacterized protein n=1 Tax=Achlya hypogyna TaxID=1202772 RepID=A0A1V9YPW6_ACHHY|nr:hypothetical protein ACHHYP_08186 [Achlya hypogyna]
MSDVAPPPVAPLPQVSTIARMLDSMDISGEATSMEREGVEVEGRRIELPGKEDPGSTEGTPVSPTSTEQITPMDMEPLGIGKSELSTPTKVAQMVDEIKTILDSPTATKIPSISKPSLIPPPAPIEKLEKVTSPMAHLKRKSMSPTQKDALAARLYSKAMDLKHKRDELFTQTPEECTFKPKIIKAPTSPHSRTSSGPPSVTSTSSEKNRFSMLHEQARELAQKKEAKKQSAQAEYSFKPQISKKSRRMSLKLRMKKSRDAAKASEGSPATSTLGSPRSADSKNIPCRFDELYAQHIELAARRKEKQLELERKTAEVCTFQPKIKKLKGKSPTKSRPLYDAERERQKRLEKESKKVALEMAECTFRPAVQRTKSTSADPTKEEKSFFDRMQESERKKEDRLEQLRREQEERKLKEATFRPKIIETKASKAATEEKKPFHERLFDKEYLLQQQAERERKKLEQDQYSFKPSIDTSLISIPERHGSIFERLHDEGMKKQELLSLAEQERIKRELEECTFHPQVSIELKDPPTEPVWERLSNDKKHILEERQRLKEALEAKDCTFKPDLGPSSRSPARRNTTLLQGPSTGTPESPPTSTPKQFRRQTSPALDLTPSNLVDPTSILVVDEVSAPQAAPTPIAPPFPAATSDEVSAQSQSILDNYDSWAATLEEKMRELK